MPGGHFTRPPPPLPAKRRKKPMRRRRVNAMLESNNFHQNVHRRPKRTLQRRRHRWLTAAAQWHSRSAETSTANMAINQTKFINFRQKVTYSHFSNLSNFCYEIFSTIVMFFLSQTLKLDATFCRKRLFRWRHNYVSDMLIFGINFILFSKMKYQGDSWQKLWQYTYICQSCV